MYFLLILLAVWSIGGIIFYISISDDITNFWKTQLARVISGPLVWIMVFLGYILGSLAFVDDIYVAFICWLRKP